MTFLFFISLWNIILQVSVDLRSSEYDCGWQVVNNSPIQDYTFPNDYITYYINTNEKPGELSRENLISSHVKITCYLHMWKYHLCYGYVINRAFHTKKLLEWNGLVFHWCLYNKKNITWPLGDTKFLFSCWKNIFEHSKRNFVSPRGHVISSMYVNLGLLLLFLCNLGSINGHFIWFYGSLFVQCFPT